MAVAGKIYKTYNTPEQLGRLSDFSLESAGVNEKDLRKLVLAAVRKAGYKQKAGAAGSSSNVASTSKADSKTNTRANQKKRKRDDDVNQFLPDRPPEEGDSYGSLEFNEVLDEEAMKSKYTVINRAPIMMAWAFIVAERMGFRREEALSIASVYTEMNAITKGVSLGLYSDSKQKGREASRTGSQPYVELMGRRLAFSSPPPPYPTDRLSLFLPSYTSPSSHSGSPLSFFRPLYQTASSQWRALSSGAPIAPTAAFSYITKALRQTAPHIVGALRLLATSYSPQELNEKGFSLYADFRPQSEGWGQRGEVRCSTILALRKARRESEASDDPTRTEAPSVDSIVKVEPQEDPGPAQAPSEEPAAKKPKRETSAPDEFDAALDDDALFEDFDLSSIP
ncbi:hypothetical protein BD309DRAFT_1072100 [Dichomitus squalens]|uniref:Uncharacterized protein n=2 Tax=Dichomitus squalens TaxID=114155 RepID=A0A4V2K9H3_9APHY|nr:uncharacterized protein DICSQDRAFT_170343 [Dichomitus squalens LYAD-421 SS1]EJF61207.1 hypothetical protein DICSQDRAFT_170343 [Dichomitus squalens LYAD-421 SS1]TBU45062.1 hypothetical protein BD309DRAFT_1072100 [Dichomitus squalens]TBU63928.1 hypothetical protein BD310DRAFT_1013649 [Dichomitus squalens]